jgi:hypothetical protein
VELLAEAIPGVDKHITFMNKLQTIFLKTKQKISLVGFKYFLQYTKALK